MKTVQDYAAEARSTLHMQIEQHLRVVIQPRPWWLPTPLWRFLLRRMVVLEMTQPSFSVVKPQL